LDEHLDVLETSLDTLLLNRENFLVAEGTYLLVASIQRSLLVGITALDQLHVALDERDAACCELVFEF